MTSWFSHDCVYTRQALSSGLAPLLTEQNPKRYMKGGLPCKMQNSLMVVYDKSKTNYTSRIRTDAYRGQSSVPYRLAMVH